MHLNLGNLCRNLIVKVKHLTAHSQQLWMGRAALQVEVAEAGIQGGDGLDGKQVLVAF